MQKIAKLAIVVAFVTAAFAQSPEPPIKDSRLSIHTLLREDIFAGFLTDDMERFNRGEKNIQALMELRPTQKAELLAWKGGATLYRAVRALENNQKEEFQRYYKSALESFSQARELDSRNGGVSAVTVGSLAIFADRLPKEYRAAAWSQAYESYQTLWKQQSAMAERLPLHLKGELLGGLAQSAQRTGHTEEMSQALDKIIAIIPNSPYESVAKKWKANPKAAESAGITCLSCHDGGRLSARLSEVNK